ncbi:MAG TPA: chorismate mutase [Verrucomicrobiae bacterium]|nr:chorismate mutase [Verrucomicrobiae bacterium]
MSELRVRGIRGAVTVAADEPEAIHTATRELLGEIVARNGLEPEDVTSVLFTLTPDLRAAFPALAARDMGWTYVPMLHAVELDVPGAIERCIRVLMHATTERSQIEIEHVYLREAASLRPDLVRR